MQLRVQISVTIALLQKYWISRSARLRRLARQLDATLPKKFISLFCVLQLMQVLNIESLIDRILQANDKTADRLDKV